MNEAEANKNRAILREAKTLMPCLATWRQTLHRHPELSGAEKNTQEYIIEQLTRMGVEVVTYPDLTCVVGIIRGEGEGKCIAIRADMDALPVQEKTNLPFASETGGVMHACGHDAHMAIVLGVARLLMAHRKEFCGCVKLFFEHAEETTGGAKEMIARGCMENPHVDAVLGLHMLPSQKAGTLLTKAGAVSGSSTDLRICVHGKNSHGAYPERGVDAIVIAAQIVTALQSVVSRSISPLDSAVVSLGQIQGGSAPNVVCDKVEIAGTLRALADATRDACIEHISAICHGIAQGMGGQCEVHCEHSYGALRNDEALHGVFERVAGDILGTENLHYRARPSLGVESFSFFTQEVPGVYYDLGSGEGAPLHAGDFMIDEECLPLGVALQTATALALLAQTA